MRQEKQKENTVVLAIENIVEASVIESILKEEDISYYMALNDSITTSYAGPGISGEGSMEINAAYARLVVNESDAQKVKDIYNEIKNKS